jgi:hypothetical protein
MRTSALMFGLFGLVAASMSDRHLAALAPQGSVAEGSIAGTVVGGDGQPLADAKVELQLINSSPSAASTVTGRDGAFLYEHLPPGHYLLLASKVGSVSMAYGSTRPRGLGTPLVLPAGGALDHLTIQLPQGGVVAGIVRRPDGSVVAGGNVAFYSRRVSATGREDWVPAAFSRTDDRGSYRASGLEPETYAIRASAAVAAAAATTARGQAFTPTFYPSVTSISNAELVSLGAAEERQGLDVVLAQVSTVHVQGQLVGDDVSSSREPAPVTLDPIPSDGGVTAGFAAHVSGDRFEFTGVVPGTYILRAAPSASRSGDRVSASTVISVGDRDMSDVTLVLHPSCVVAGRIAAEGSGRVLDLARIRVGLRPEAGAGSIPGASASGTALADGTFAVALDASGQYRFVVQNVGPQLDPAPLVKSIVMDGREVSDIAVALVEGQRASGILITLTDHLGTVSGSLTGRNGQPATKYTVVAFPANRDLWGTVGRRIRAARPANTGEFVLAGLPAGQYDLAAVLDPQPNAWFVSSFLETLIPSAVSILVSNSTTTIQNLRVSDGADVTRNSRREP